MLNDDTISRQLSQYVFRSILSTVGASIYVLADSFFVSKSIGVLGVAVMNLTMPLFNIMDGLGLLLGMGGGTLFTIFRIKNKQKAKQTYTLTLIIGLMSGLLFTILGLFLPFQISKLLGADSTTISYTLKYVKIILFFGPFFVLNNLFLSFLRNDNGTRIAMFAMILSSLTNVFLDWLLILKLNLGMFGAGLATSFSPLISILISLLHLNSEKNNLSLCKPEFNLKIIVKTFTIGLPSFLTEMSTGFEVFIYNWMFLKVSGNNAVVAYGIAANVLIVALALFTGVAQGIQPIVSHYYTKKDLNLIKFSLRYGLTIAESLGLLCYIFVFFNSHLVINFFSASSNLKVVSMAIIGLHILLLSLIFSSLNVVFNIFFSAINNSHISTLMVIIRGYVLPLFIVILSAKLGSIITIWESLFVIELISFILELSAWIFIKRNLKRNNYRI